MYLYGATIAPDGSRVVFAAGGYRDTDVGLFVVDAEGGQPVRIAQGRGPTFSPDGTQIAYVSTDRTGPHVWVANADGSDAHEILADEPALAENNVSLAWSPAGDRIAMDIGLEGHVAIYTFAPDGSDFTRVITGGVSPYWSPDGSQIAYTIPCDEHPSDSCPVGTPLRSLFDPQPGDPPAGLAIADADGSNVRAFGFAASGPWHPGASVQPDEPIPDPGESFARANGEVLRYTGHNAYLSFGDLLAVNPETGEKRVLMENLSNVRSAEWSADGRWVAFEVTHANLDGPPIGPCAPTVGVWVTNALGELRQVTTPCDAPPPQSDAVEEVWEWSPVGARLAYARVDGQADELFVIDPADGSRTSLGTTDIEPRNGLTAASPGWALEWSPDGARIAYADGGSVYVVDADGGESSLLADSFEEIIEIAWSPDGAHILVHDQGRYRLQVMNADGSDLHVVLEGEDACCSTAWSPNGDRILYMLSTVQPGQNPNEWWHSETWTVSPDGSNPIKVFDSITCGTFAAMHDTLPVWSPDGTQVAYNACGAWVAAKADGTGEQPIDELVWRSWYSGGLTEEDLRQNGQYDH
jgi:Tol biopolymer transport system component